MKFPGFFKKNDRIGYSDSIRTVNLVDSSTVAGIYVDQPIVEFTLDFTSGVGTTRLISNPSSSSKARRIIFRFKQDATGSRVVTWDTKYRFSGGVYPTLTTGASKVDYIGFIYNPSDDKWDCVSYQFNY